MNEVLFVEAAQSLAMKALAEGGKTDRDRVDYVFRRCTNRKPSDDEAHELLGLLARQQQHFADGWAEPKVVAFKDSAQEKKLPEGVTPTKLAAWTLVARVALNLDETITKE